MNEELAWKAVLARDSSVDGRFVYGVVTTGVYCRPACPSRRPLRQNVRFYPAPADAERDGLRACRRCRPEAAAVVDPIGDRIRWLCRHIEANPETRPVLAELGALVHWSPAHLQRQFKDRVGVTPKQYAEACRLDSLKRSLRENASVTGAIFDAGFGSTSRVYERVETRIGMTPGEYRAGGAGVAVSYAFAQTPVGLLLMAATDRGLCSVQLGDSEAQMLEALRAEYPAATLSAMPPDAEGAFDDWMSALRAYLDGTRIALDLPADVRGTAFQMRVWDYLRRIPHGQTCTYGQVAEAIGRPDAVRAVAGACAANRLALTVPCHRVIRGDGGLGGYRWGVGRKQALIEQERVAARMHTGGTPVTKGRR